METGEGTEKEMEVEVEREGITVAMEMVVVEIPKHRSVRRDECINDWPIFTSSIISAGSQSDRHWFRE